MVKHFIPDIGPPLPEYKFCEVCSKKCYPTKGAANRAAVYILTKELVPVLPYFCAWSQSFHLTKEK